jgi:glutamate carboxypeptidase
MDLIPQLHALVPDMLRLTRELVEINSYTQNIAGVNAVGAQLRDAFALPGLNLREHTSEGCGTHLFWSTPASDTQAPLLLIGHHDTVFPPGHFEGYREEQDRAYGPGCLDMKGGLAIVWGVLKLLSQTGALADLPLIIACVADEETGSIDSRPHLEALARRARAALVFEAGRRGDAIITARRGVGGLRVLAEGQAAHAGAAHREGRNAIRSLARFVEFAESQTDYARGTTVNVGTIRGGTTPNTVPESAQAEVDMRFESVADAHALLQTLHEAAERVALPGTRLRVEGGIKRLPMEPTPASRALFEAYAECQRLAGLGSEEHPLVGGGSDANTVAGVGLPAIDGLGPRGAGFHTTHEYIEPSSFGMKAEALLRFLCSAR